MYQTAELETKVVLSALGPAPAQKLQSLDYKLFFLERSRTAQQWEKL